MALILPGMEVIDSLACSSAHIISARQSMHPCCALETERKRNAHHN